MQARIRPSLLLLLLVSSWAVAAEDSSTESGLDLGQYLTWEYWRDWHIGLAANVAQLPYDGVDQRASLFPLVTRVDDYVFTRQRLAGREGVGILRFWQPAPWDFSLVGQVQNLGYESDDSAVLAGMRERDRSLDGGLMIGFRAEQWYAELLAMTDLLGRHEGQNYTLSVGRPLRPNDQVQIIPHVDIIRSSSGFVDYYFGVSPGEATDARPRYTGATATTIRLAARGTYRLRDSRWAVVGNVRVHRLGSEIDDSPLIDKRTVWGISLGAAYRFGDTSNNDD